MAGAKIKLSLGPPRSPRTDNLSSVSRFFVGGGSVPRSGSPDGAGSYRTAPLRGMPFARFPECVWPAAALTVVNRPIANIVTIDRASISGVARRSPFIVQNVNGQQLSQEADHWRILLSCSPSCHHRERLEETAWSRHPSSPFAHRLPDWTHRSCSRMVCSAFRGSGSRESR